MRITIRQLFAILLFIGLFIMTIRPVLDPDFWWHLRTGQMILETHIIPHSDPYSFTKAGSPWIAHEWLSELTMAVLYNLGSYGLLILILSLIITGAFFLTYLQCPSTSRPYIAGFVLLLGALSTAPTWGVRPQMISLFLASQVLYLLYRYRQSGKIHYLVPLPFLTLIWVNMHAGFLLGLGVIAVYIVGSLAEILLANLFQIEEVNRLSMKDIVVISIFFGISILSTLINPNGVKILIYPFQTLTSPSMQHFIQEWFSPDFHQLMWQPLALFFLAIIGFGMLGKKPLRPTQIILTLVFGYAALISARHVPLFAIVAIPPLAEKIDSLIHIPSEDPKQVKLLQVIAPAVIVFTLLLGVGRLIQATSDQTESEAQVFPRAAVNWIVQNQPEGQIFNSYGWGGYIIWRLYPAYRVYIDGRADVYGDQFLYAFMNVYRANPGWEKTLEIQDIRIILVEPGSSLANALRQTSGWTPAFEDDVSVLFIRNSTTHP